MPRYLLDTDICSYIMKRSNQVLLKRLQQVRVSDVCISVITKSELIFGVEMSPRRQQDESALEAFLPYIDVLGTMRPKEDERAEFIRSALLECLLSDDPEKVRTEGIRRFAEISKPVLDQLAEAGYQLKGLSDLRHQGKPWESALPILLNWLPKIDDPDVKEDIVRCLSVPWVGNKATPELIAEFKVYSQILRRPSNPWVGKQLRDTPVEEKKLGVAYSLAWAIGNALSIVDVGGFEKQIIELCRNSRYGRARQMIVFGLGRLRDPQAEETALELLADEDVKLHAIIALGKMKSKRALFELERLLPDKSPGISREARKAITKIMR